MGAAASSHKGQPEVRYNILVDYHDSLIKYASGASLESFTSKEGVRMLALAYQASDAAHVGSPSQHIRFGLSKDGGETWSKHTVVVWGLQPIWNPVLFFDKTTSRLFLFYGESRKAVSPGGDVKCIHSSDAGETWSEPTTILTHEQDGEVPKVVASKPVVGKDGTWYLPYHTEPAGSYKVFSPSLWCSMRDAEEHLPQPAAPAAAPAQSVVTYAGVLVSPDKGASWKVGGHVEDNNTWLIQPSLEVTTDGNLLMLFRTAAGRIYHSRSKDGAQTWTKPAAVSLLNPNAKFSSLTTDGQILLVHHPSSTSRSMLGLALSVNDGKSWEPLYMVEEVEKDGKLTDPCILEWSDDTVKVGYTVWGQGLKLATLRLATVENSSGK